MVLWSNRIRGSVLNLRQWIVGYLKVNCYDVCNLFLNDSGKKYGCGEESRCGKVNVIGKCS